jgi:hypothetical protein
MWALVHRWKSPCKPELDVREKVAPLYRRGFENGKTEKASEIFL